jgi:cell division protein ZapA (FtsZ GTPase activity inhibitor)
MKQNTLKERILRIMRTADSRTDFCYDVGIMPDELHRIYKGEEPIHIELIQGVSKAYPRVNLQWLLHGVGAYKLKDEALSPDEIRITIRVLNVSFNLQINREHEDFFRKAERILKDELIDIKLKYPEISIDLVFKVIALRHAKENLKENLYCKFEMILKDKIREIKLDYTEIPIDMVLEQMTLRQANVNGEFDNKISCVKKELAGIGIRLQAINDVKELHETYRKTSNKCSKSELLAIVAFQFVCYAAKREIKHQSPSETISLNKLRIIARS